MLHARQGNVVMPGQVCKFNDASLSFMTGLGWRDKLYTNIEKEKPLNEQELLIKGRFNALLGYGCGLHTYNVVDGSTVWKPTLIKDFININKCSTDPILEADPMPVLYKQGGTTRLYNLTADSEAYFTPIDKVELLLNIKESCNWSGINYRKYKSKLSKVLRDCYIGWNVGGFDGNKVKADIPNTKKYFHFSADWNPDNPLAVLNSRIINIL